MNNSLNSYKMKSQPKYYNSLVSNRSKGGEGICQFEQDYPPEVLAGCFLVAEEMEGGDRSYYRYLVFEGGVDDFKKYVLWQQDSPMFSSNNEKLMYFHEVIPAHAKQKLRIDVDIDPKFTDAIDIDGMIDNLITSIGNAAKSLWGIELTREDFVVCTASGPTEEGTKESFHIIVLGYYITSSDTLSTFLDMVMKEAESDAYCNYIDPQIAGNLKNFRILGSCKRKYGLPRIKRFYKDDNFTLEDTLITHIGKLDQPLKTIEKQRRLQLSDDTGLVTSDFDVMMEGLKKLGYCDRFHYRNNRGQFYYFIRDAPDVHSCAICEAYGGEQKIHQRDNTFYVSCITTEDTIKVYAKCWRCKVPKSSMFLFEFPSTSGIYKAIQKPEIDTTASKKILAERLTQHTIRPIDHSDRKYLTDHRNRVHSYAAPTLSPFEHVSTLCVLAGMKMGKTKELKRYISQHFPNIEGERPPIIRFISFRMTFSSNIKQSFPDFVLYSDEKGNLTHPRLIVQVESLHRLDVMPQYRPDLVILDESESIFEQFSSKLGKRSQDSWAKFEWLMHQAKHVIAMDAALSDRTVDMINRLRCQSSMFLGDPTITIHNNTYKNATGDKYSIVTDRSVFHAMLYQDLKDGLKIAIPTSSKAEADILFESIPTKFPGIRINVYSSDTAKSIKNEHFGKVNDYWNQYTVILYTPTVSAGVSFEKQHFDKIYAWFTDSSCSVWSCIQMLGRVRNVSTKQYIIGMNFTGGGNLADTADSILTNIKNNRNSLYTLPADGIPFEYTYDTEGQIKIYESNFVRLWLENTAASNRSRNEFAKLFCYHVRNYGATIEVINGSGFDQKILRDIHLEDKAIADKNAELKVNAIANAPDISKPAYIDLVNKFDELTIDETHTKVKYELRIRYDYTGQIDTAWVRTYRSDMTKRHFKNLKAIASTEPVKPGESEATRLWRSLAEIQKNERERFEGVLNAKDKSLEINDVAAKYIFKAHRNALGLIINECGFNGFFDVQKISSHVLKQRLLPRISHIITAVNGIEEDKGAKPRSAPINLNTFPMDTIAEKYNTRVTEDIPAAMVIDEVVDVDDVDYVVDDEVADEVVDDDIDDDDDDIDGINNNGKLPAIKKPAMVQEAIVPRDDQKDQEILQDLINKINDSIGWLYGVKIEQKESMYSMKMNPKFCYTINEKAIRGQTKPFIGGLR